MRFSLELDAHLNDLYNDLQEERYKVSGYRIIYIYVPKKRLIMALTRCRTGRCIFQMLRCGPALAYKIVSIPRHLPEVFCLLSSNRPAATYPTNPTCRRLPYIRNQYKSLYRRALIIPASLQYKFLSAGRFSCLPLSACAAAACGFTLACL